jgi:MYXO-CTERM domain-containing protein
MILQLLRHGIGKPTLCRVAGLAFVFSVLGMAQAQVATHTQLTSSTSDHGFTFTAQVSDIAGNPATDGVVTLANAQGASLGSAFVKNGEATFSLDQQLAGRIYADYSGSQSFRASTAQVQASSDATSSTLPDFTITAAPSALSLTAGQYGTVILTITPLNGFADMVTLSCSGNPAASACTFSPVTLTPLNGKAVTSSLQITTQGASGASLVWPGHSGSHTAYAIVLPGLLALAGLGAMRRRSGLNTFRMLGLVALLAASTLGLSACSQRYDYLHHPPATNPALPAGTYNITVAAYSNNGASVTSHTLNVTLTVK